MTEEVNGGATKPKRNHVDITISGLTGSGKSAIMSEVIVALRAIGVEVQTEKEWRYEMAGRTGDSFVSDIEDLNPIVTIREVNIPYPASARKGQDQ